MCAGSLLLLLLLLLCSPGVAPCSLGGPPPPQKSSWLAPSAYLVTAARGVLRLATLNAVFVSSGSLAALLAVALLSDSLILLYCELGKAQLPGVPVSSEDETLV